MIAARRACELAALCSVQLAFAQPADGWDLTLRAADEPAAKAKLWDQGATLSYQSVNGKSVGQADLILKMTRSVATKNAPIPGRDAEQAGSRTLQVQPAAYLHRTGSSTNPQNDRGGSLGVGWHFIPASTGTGAVVTYDAGATVSAGRTLKHGSGTAIGQYFDAQSGRLIGYGSLFYQPDRGELKLGDWAHYAVASLKVYLDRVSGAQNASANGTVSGTALSIQYSLAPFGLDPAQHKVAGYGFAPILSLSAQGQRDSSATGERLKGNRSLFAFGASFPFTPTSGGVTPSIEIQRSVGADVLQGREERNETRIALGLKF